jgi:hypothetical protein
MQPRIAPSADSGVPLTSTQCGGRNACESCSNRQNGREKARFRFVESAAETGEQKQVQKSVAGLVSVCEQILLIQSSSVKLFE